MTSATLTPLVAAAQGAELFLGNAGPAMRPLTAAVAAAGRGRFVLDGVARMRERPIQDLVDRLVQLGVDASCSMGTGCPPVVINAAGLPSGKVGGERHLEARKPLLQWHVDCRSVKC